MSAKCLTLGNLLLQMNLIRIWEDGTRAIWEVYWSGITSREAHGAHGADRGRARAGQPVPKHHDIRCHQGELCLSVVSVLAKAWQLLEFTGSEKMWFGMASDQSTKNLVQVSLVCLLSGCNVSSMSPFGCDNFEITLNQPWCIQQNDTITNELLYSFEVCKRVGTKKMFSTYYNYFSWPILVTSPLVCYYSQYQATTMSITHPSPHTFNVLSYLPMLPESTAKSMAHQKSSTPKYPRKTTNRASRMNLLASGRTSRWNKSWASVPYVSPSHWPCLPRRPMARRQQWCAQGPSWHHEVCRSVCLTDTRFSAIQSPRFWADGHCTKCRIHYSFHSSDSRLLEKLNT